MDAKLQRAQQHIFEVSKLVGEYLSQTPVRISAKSSECGQWNIYYISEITAPSSNISCAIGDALCNLRASLDHLMMLLVSKHCNPETIKPEQVYFPIYAEKRFRKWRTEDSHARQLSPCILETLERFQPFRRDSRTLSILRDLNNIDKHRNILVAALNYDSINLLSMFDRQTAEIFITRHGADSISNAASLWIRDKDTDKAAAIGQEVTRYKTENAPSNPLVKFDFSVVERNIETRPVIALLAEINQEVTSVHEAFKPFL